MVELHPVAIQLQDTPGMRLDQGREIALELVRRQAVRAVSDVNYLVRSATTILAG
jgi:hypothetical protein